MARVLGYGGNNPLSERPIVALAFLPAAPGWKGRRGLGSSGPPRVSARTGRATTGRRPRRENVGGCIPQIAAVERNTRAGRSTIATPAKSAAAVALIRHFATQWARWGHVETLYYWRSSSNREVDFVIRENGHFHGLEVKYQNTVSGWDELSIVRGIGRGILVTRDAFEFAPVPRIPLWAFLTMQI